jgi:hypothetical protein
MAVTAFLTLIAVILAAAALEKDQGSAPAPVQIVIVTPGNAGFPAMTRSSH